MKNKFARIFGIGLVVTMLIALLLPASAGAGTLSFTKDTSVPSTTSERIATGVGILDMAVNGDTVFVVGGNIALSPGANENLWKSTNGGTTWSALSEPNAVLNLVAVAPDDPDVVVAFGGAGTNLVGYVSTNGGSTWSALGTVQDNAATAAVNINDIAVSPLSSGIRYIGCAGQDVLAEGDGPGLYYFNLGAAAPSWTDAVLDFTTALTVGEIDNFRTLEFSPNFASDQVMVAVSEQIGTAGPLAGAVRFHIASFNQKAWDASIFTGYPVSLETSTNTAFTCGGANISLDPDYLGGDDTMRVAFVGAQIADAGVEAGGIYRLKDTTKKDMKDATAIKGVAWDGTNLVAGGATDATAATSNVVYRSADALASTPTVLSSRSNKRVGGTGATNTLVAWVGSNVVGANTGGESAFSRSNDNGQSFNDISLIDTAMTNIIDLYVSPDAAVTYLVSNDATDTSVWRKKDGVWERTLVIMADAGAWIVRALDSDPNAVYVAKTGATNIFYDATSGNNKWTVRASRYNIADIAVESADVAYVAVNGASTVSKTDNAGFTWGTSKSTSLIGGNCYMIRSLGEGLVIVGSTAGYVTYSTDGNSSWEDIASIVPGTAGNVIVDASGLATDSYIYAINDGAAANTARRWQIGTSTSWSNTDTTPVITQTPEGLELTDDGVLYVLANTAGNSEVNRTLNPSSSAPTWVNIASAGETYATGINALKVSTGSTKLWFVETVAAPDELWSYTDTLAGTDTAPTLNSPAAGFRNPVNSISGAAPDIAFQWTRNSLATSYHIDVYADAAGTARLQRNVVPSTATTVVSVIGPNQVGTAFLTYTPGATYYWRVRANLPAFSPFSEMRSFTIEPGQALVPQIASPENGKLDASRKPSFSWSPVGGATEYQFVLGFDTTFSKPLVSATVTSTAYVVSFDLNYGQTYYWRVKPTAPIEGDWSSVANFQVMDKPVEPTPPVVIEQVPPPIINIPAPPPAQEIVIPPAPQPPAPIAPTYIWAIIIIGAVLVIAVIILIIRTRRAV